MRTLLKRKEILILTAAWVLIFLSDPAYMYYAKLTSQFEFRWQEIFHLWSYDACFMVLFLIHHFVLVPQLMNKKRKWPYISSVVVCVAAFASMLVLLAPPFDAAHEARAGHSAAQPPLLAPPDLARLVMALLMIGVDLGAVAWFNDQKLRQRLLLLEQQALKQELVQLRYQINPHFFMNTLNNIHALVDIDQERAKRSIVELSRMMRYSLYEGNESVTPLQHEIEFLQLYISLMRLRFDNRVDLHCDFPDVTATEAMIPPLLLATFVENAFKHGISYQSTSFIHIAMTLDKEAGIMHFRCVNSHHFTTHKLQDEHHGIGLVNVRKRLDLQYSGRYTLTIDETDSTRYVVDLTMPTAI